MGERRSREPSEREVVGEVNDFDDIANGPDGSLASGEDDQRESS